jgi:hypothetical protein
VSLSSCRKKSENRTEHLAGQSVFSNMKRRWVCVLFLALLGWVKPLPAAQDRIEVGQNIVVGPGETFADVVCVGCSVRVEGTVAGDLVTIGGDIDVDSRVRGDVAAIGGVIKLNSGASVGGDVVAPAGRVERDPLARVGGEVISMPMFGVGIGVFLFIAFFAVAVLNIILAVLCYLVAGERRVRNITGAARDHTGMTFLTGLGIIVGTVVVFIVASVSGPAAPLLVVSVLVVLLVTLIAGYTGLSSWLGTGLTHASGVGAVLIGAILITVLQLIPLLGAFVLLVFTVLALGSAALSGYGTAADWLVRQFSTTAGVAPPARSHQNN